MKKFSFSLARMMSYKEQILEKEKETMGRLTSQRDGLEKRRREIMDQLEIIHGEMEQEIQKGTTILHINAFTAIIKTGKDQLEEIKKRINVCNSEIERQRQVVIEASREVKKLEKLREKQLEEYHHSEQKEQEEIISEHVSGSYVRSGVSYR